MIALVSSAAVLVGAAFMLVAALGVVRLPDLYTRMQAATKASTVGVVAMMAAIALAHADASVTIRAVLVAGFFLLTSPVAAHAIARSAHTRKVPVAPGTRVDLGEREPHVAGAPGALGAPGGGSGAAPVEDGTRGAPEAEHGRDGVPAGGAHPEEARR